MRTTTLVTADELLAMPTGMGKRYELLAGELREMLPSGWRHGKVASRLNARLDTYVEEHDLGVVFGAETGFRLASDPDTVRAPDVSFISKQNMPEREPNDGFWPGAPDLAVEVLSPSDRTGEVNEKTDFWLSAGCKAVWVVDPKRKTVTIYSSQADVQVKTADEVLQGDPVVPGFSCAVAELFR
ncbi:MAG: Uma2 family endonuclease [Pirellulales bacterium]